MDANVLFTSVSTQFIHENAPLPLIGKQGDCLDKNLRSEIIDYFKLRAKLLMGHAVGINPCKREKISPPFFTKMSATATRERLVRSVSRELTRFLPEIPSLA